MLREHILDVEQVEQRVVEHCVRVAARRGVEGCDAVVEQFARLRRDAVHQLHILQGDDRIVATQIVPVVVHAHVGVEGLVARYVEGGEAPGGVEITRLALVDEIDHGRRARCGARRKRDICGGVEVAVRHVEIEREQQHQPQRGPAARARPHCQPEQQAARQREGSKAQHVEPLVAPETAPIGKGGLGEVAAIHNALAEGNEGIGRKQGGERHAQRAHPRQPGRKCEAARPGARLVAQQQIQPAARQRHHTERKGEDPAEGAVQLVPAGQPIEEQRVERRAKGEEQREQRQSHKEAHVYGA